MKERSTKAVRSWYERNRPAYNASQRERRKTDLHFATANVLRTRINHALRNPGGKRPKLEILIGCTVPELIVHISVGFGECKIDLSFFPSLTDAQFTATTAA